MAIKVAPATTPPPAAKRKAVEISRDFEEPQAPKEWTVLYYLDGNNDLEPYIMKNMRQLEQVGSDKNVNIVAQMSRAPQEVVHKKAGETTKIDGDWVGSRRYFVTQSPAKSKNLRSPVLSASDESPNHGDPANLTDFLKWGMQKFPAKHYMVVIGDHGKGFVGTGFDILHKDHLSLPELKTAFADAQKATGKKPDILAFDACEMASLEVAYQLKDQAKVMVASEEILGLDGLPHIPFLQNLQRHPKASPADHAANLVEYAREDELDRIDDERPDVAMQLSAVDLSKVGALAKATAGLGKALEKSDISRSDLKRIVSDTKHFCEGTKSVPDSQYRDLGHFCNNLVGSDDTDESVRKAAKAVLGALSKAVLAHENEGEDMEETTGLSAYIPTSAIPDRFNRKEAWGKFNDSYHDTDFDQDTKWSGWVNQKFARAV